MITDSVEQVNGKNYSNGNEFVWIPIDKTNLTVGKTSKKMAEISSGTDYMGVLYNWESDTNGNTALASDGGYKEPSTTLYDTRNYYTEYGIDPEIVKNEYNTMIASVKEYGGFYVGRYEIGKGENNYSKINVEVTSASINDENMWYGLYTKAKSYNKTGTTSEMIWGSQYDAMLNFGLTNSTDSSKINAKINGNHTVIKLKSGIYQGLDVINNIFDLEGNMYEWTKEFGVSECRVLRGGAFQSSGSLYFLSSPSKRQTWVPSENTADINGYTFGSRLSLYINQ